MTENLTWISEETEQIADCRVFTVHRNRASLVRDGRKRTHNFYLLKTRTWVNVIPVTADGNVVMIEQFRAGINGITLEIPGGTVDATDHSSKEAGARELLEETGFISDELIFLGRTHPNPAIQDNFCDTYLAPNARPIQEPCFDGSEEIALKVVPLKSVPNYIKNGTITHALVIVAFHYLCLFQAQDT